MEEESDVKPAKTSGSVGTKYDPRAEALKIIAAQRKKNAESVVVKVTMVDKREASTATSAYFNNGTFGMRVPLDTFVEMPRILVMQAEKAKALTHIQTDSGSIPKLQKKYVVEYKN